MNRPQKNAQNTNRNSVSPLDALGCANGTRSLIEDATCLTDLLSGASDLDQPSSNLFFRDTPREIATELLKAGLLK